MKNRIQKLMFGVLVLLQIACAGNRCDTPRMVGKDSASGIQIEAILDDEINLGSDEHYNVCYLYVQDFILTTSSGKVYLSEDYTAALSPEDSLEVKELIDSFSIVSTENPIISARLEIADFYDSTDSPSTAKLHLELKDLLAANPDEVLATISIPLRKK